MLSGSKEFNLAPKEVCPLPSAPESLTLSSLNSYLIKVSLFIWGHWAKPDSLTMWFMVRTLGHSALAQPPKVLEMEVSHWNSQLCLRDRAPVKTMNTKVWKRFPGWQYSTYTVSHHTRKINAIHDPTMRGQLSLHAQSFPGLCPFPLADSNLYLFTIVNHHCEKNSLQ